MTDMALVFIDVQKGFTATTWGERNNPMAEHRMKELLQYWREKKRLIIHVQHASKEISSPLHPAKSGFAFQDSFEPLPGEWHVIKSVNSAFIGTGLHVKLREHHIEDLVFAGLTTPHCVSTTVRMAANYGYNCTVVEDATAAFRMQDHRGEWLSAEESHQFALAHLHQEFAHVQSTSSLVREQAEVESLFYD
ncbi:cysteine hydrolase family protein [Aureibacillus halotolerans]|uniref:Nicotinamidase-related amidase n=1 Tax=Aureibacillus halotolerans TaxID=1508390 RepID=A0A4R6TX86_9BACI|nr:cysteine hydrolase family protein [Aureibacillus halotolerans]TDQ34125.1 nicotinamidase-related amidase [Aureibacillus halotolerans]